MTQIIIPGNTTNCISKIYTHQLESRKTYLFLGSLPSTEKSILREYHINSILTVGCGLEVMPPSGIVHKVINIEDHPMENIAQYFS